MSRDRQTINVGIIGAGGMGGRHARNLHKRVKGAQVTAIMDADADRANRVANECGGTQVLNNAQALIESDQVDAILIASPDATHAGLVLAAIAQGKPVLCEKPLATTSADAQRIIAAELALGRRVVQVGFMRHYDPQHVAVKQAIEAGTIGRPVLFKGWHRNMLPDPGATSAEIIIGSAIHDLDSARWLMGQEVASVLVQGVNTDPALGADVWDLQVIQLAMRDGTLATIEVYVNAQYGYEVGVEVVGTHGTAQSGSTAPAALRHGLTLAQAIEPDWLVRFDPAYLAELQSWIDTLRRGEPLNGPSAWDGYTALVVAEACIQSLQTRQAQAVTQPERPALYA